ncbi:hypothetical protein [Humibacillus xanthopallidus]|uniref:hypothetical protein n=1 Tax=Humibacillus xanthopallidus TaxID=412689 RepID=UPI00384F91C3
MSMTVLAVTEDPIGSANGVYRRQNELLGLPEEAKAPLGYDSVPGLWRIWNEWLSGPGARYGRPSAKAHERWTLQGWARSQGLVRFSDRLLIEDFLSSVRIGPADVCRAEQVTEDFLAWLRYRGERGRKLLTKFSDDAAIDVLREVMGDEVVRWTGTRRQVRQRGHQLQALLTYDEWSEEFGLAVPVDQRLLGQDVAIDGDQVHIDEFLPYLRLPSEPDMLRSGASIAITQGIKVRFSPEPAYVLRDEPAVEGTVQARGAASSKAYRVLVDGEHLAETTEVLRRAGHCGHSESAAKAGWYWFTDVMTCPDTSELRALGLGALASPRPTSMELSGGLRLSRGTYLVGFEPDLAVPEGVAITLDGVPIDVHGDASTALCNRSLVPGRHVVSTDGGDSVSFVTLTHVQERARGSELGWRLGTNLEPVRDLDQPVSTMTLSGAAIRGMTLRIPSVARLMGGRECLVVSAIGEIRQVWPATEGWLQEIALEPGAIDLSRALRDLLPDSAFFLFRNQRTGAIDAMALHRDVPASPGKVSSITRPDLASALFQKWRWLGDADTELRDEVLTKTLGRAHSPAAATRPATAAYQGLKVDLRADVTAGPVETNPYNDILNWLSEREGGTASLEQFRDAWAWSCARHGLPELELEERLALYRLERLGFLERDYARRRIGVARPALSALPSANGLLILTGARPTRLIQRLDDESDPDEVIAEAIMSIDIQPRTQLDAHGRPIAPTVLYVSFDPSQVAVVRAGMDRLGIAMQGVASEAILGHAPDARHALGSAMRYIGSPGRHFLRRKTGPEGVAGWSPAASDNSRGLYEYRLPYGSVFAYRTEWGGDLVKVDRQLGSWVDAGAQGHRKLLKYLLTHRKLYVPQGRSLPLPPLLDRALVLRTGLLPTATTLSPRGFGRSANYWVYENVDLTTATHVADLLAQTLDEITRKDYVP